MFYVDVTKLKQALKNRGLKYQRNGDGTVTVDGKVFDRSSDLDLYLMSIPREDLTIELDKIMGRKKVADMTPDELETYRAYMRKKKRESREGKPPEVDKRTKRDRAEYMRERRKIQALGVDNE
tara:strand:- start:5625 stop:5993 length:369 start_codon:yes stop_codon:yes gene_type:complete